MTAFENVEKSGNLTSAEKMDLMKSEAKVGEMYGTW